MINIKQCILGPSVWILLGSFIVAIGIYRAAEQTKKFEAEVKAKNEEISRLNEYILSSITGGDSFCYLALASISHTSNTALLTAVSKGKYPLYDVGVRIVDLEGLDKIKDNLTFENIAKTERNINIGNISPNSATILEKINLSSGNEKKYNVFISARNGFFTQLIRLRRIDGEWKTAMKIEKTEGEKKINLYEKIDDKFPRDEKGKINWK